MRDAIRAANDAIFERTLSEQDKRGMGTTATVLVLLPRRYLIGQVGDSRAYLLRERPVQQLTKDHSYVQEQVDAGLLTPDQARVHPYSNVITRCVGASMDVVPDIYFGYPGEGGRPAARLRRPHRHAGGRAALPILCADGGPQNWVDRMVTEANRRGGLDNITAIVVRIDSVDSDTGEHTTAAAAAAAQLVGPRGNGPLHLDVGPRVLDPRLDRHPRNPYFAVQPDGRPEPGIRDQHQTSADAGVRGHARSPARISSSPYPRP